MAKRRTVVAQRGLPANPVQLIVRQTEIEAHLAALLEKSASGVTIEQFKKFIYEKGSVITFAEYVSATLRQFPILRRDVDY